VSTERHKPAAVNIERDEENRIQHSCASWNIVSTLTREFDISHSFTLSVNNTQELIITERVGRDLMHLSLIQYVLKSNPILGNG
jgi:predicted ATP-binding protein involved in virulence